MEKILFVAFAILFLGVSTHAAREMRYPNEDSPHFLYLPQKIDPAKTYWVVVGVHGAGGGNRGAKGISGWADKKDNVIVIAPKFGKTYQNAYPEDQKILIDLFEKLQKEYKVHPKMFIYGFSGGSQFGHRFVMKQPDYVCGASTHSGGSWSTRVYGDRNDDAKHIPFAISCGENDTGKAWGEAPLGRLEWYKEFEAAMAKEEFFYKGAIWPGAGHGGAPGMWKMTEECFALATTGVLPGSAIAKKLDEAKTLAATGEFDTAQKIKSQIAAGRVELPEDSGWHDSKESLAARKALVKTALLEIDTSPLARRRFGLYTKCVQLLKSGKKPEDEALLSFVKQCPATYWQGKADSKLVLDACNKAAADHVGRLREQKKLSVQTCKTLIPVLDGLDVGTELLKEYDTSAQRDLDKILSTQRGTFRKRSLEKFIRQWQFGTAVGKAKAAL